MKTIEEYIDIYEKKMGEKHTVPQGVKQYFLPDRGYAQIAMFKKDTAMLNDSVVVWELCGDAKFWHDFAVILCKENNCKYLTTLCTRAILPYIRFWGWKIVKETRDKDNLLIRVDCINQYGKPIEIGLAWRNNNAKRESERYSYWVKSEVN